MSCAFLSVCVTYVTSPRNKAYVSATYYLGGMERDLGAMTSDA